MSIEAMRAVWQHSETRGNARMVLTLIANAANREGWDSYQFQSSIAAAANIEEGTVQKCVAKAVELGELEVHRPDRTKQNRYSVMLPGLAIFDDEEERDRRDSTYETLSMGRAAQTQQNRANRRSEDPHVHTGPSADDLDEDPHEHAGGTRTPVGVGPARTSGSDPHVHTGPLKESLNTKKQQETPVKDLAPLVEAFWSLYPHHRRDLDAARTLDVLAGLGIDDVVGVEQITAAIREDLESDDFLEKYVPKLSNWLRDRKWDRPVADVVELVPLAKADQAASDRLDHDIREAIGADRFDTFLTHSPWYGVRGATLIVGTPNDAGFLKERYGRVLDTVARNRGFAGVEVIRAANPHRKENTAA